jgi:hypothetical protein
MICKKGMGSASPVRVSDPILENKMQQQQDQHSSTNQNWQDDSPFPTDDDNHHKDFRQHAISLPWNWPTASLCELHSPAQGPRNKLILRYTRLPEAWTCPDCGESVPLILRRDKEIMSEFLKIMSELLSEAHR